jgi:hypothetical protein
MNRYPLPLAALLSLAGCVPGYTSAEFVYAQPAEYTYVVPVDRVVIVTREVLVQRGWEVFRVEDEGPNRIIWARRGDGDEVVRIFATPQGERVIVRGLWEARERRKHGDRDERDEEGDDDREHHDRGRHRGWVNRGQPREIITDIDVRLRRG